MTRRAWRIAVIGAGPVGLALALHARALLPQARVTLFDARPADRDVAADPRTLALARGSVMFLERLGVWPRVPADTAMPIRRVHVSQLAPAWPPLPSVGNCAEGRLGYQISAGWAGGSFRMPVLRGERFSGDWGS